MQIRHTGSSIPLASHLRKNNREGKIVGERVGERDIEKK